MVGRLSATFAFLLCFLLTASLAGANSTQFLTFAGLQDGQMVGNFYNGGGPVGTPNYGITFSSNFYGLKPISQGGGGNFLPDPTGTTAIFFTASSSPTYISSSSGFGSGVNFFYTAAFQETVTVWSGANGTGTVLSTMNLAVNDGNCTTVGYCNWTDVSLSFSGTAKSITFSGPADGIGISDITLGSSVTAIPEPSSIYLLGTGVVGFFVKNLRRLKKS